MHQSYKVHMLTLLTGIVENSAEFVHEFSHSYNSPGFVFLHTQNVFRNVSYDNLMTNNEL